jgi:Holliday junction DNA helicase RuvA
VYAYLNGKISYKRSDFFVIDVNGVGYKVFCANPLLARIPPQGEDFKVFTHLIVREDVMALYGFTNQEELLMFELLLTVSGIGPKVAGLLVGNIEPTRFAMAVLSSDTALISEVKGIGKKGAERIVLELKDKLKGISFENESSVGKDSITRQTPYGGKYSEACSALAVLGYTATEANIAVRKVFNDEMEIENIIKAALRELM